jgi:hypothetical protein
METLFTIIGVFAILWVLSPTKQDRIMFRIWYKEHFHAKQE